MGKNLHKISVLKYIYCFKKVLQNLVRSTSKSGLCRQKSAQDFSFKILSSDFYILVLGF